MTVIRLPGMAMGTPAEQRDGAPGLLPALARSRAQTTCSQPYDPGQSGHSTR
ncbi:MAG: hypothetical protein M3P46_08720 [Actinomycetota bacterium]|nr:hypothetical protein [Actinomycetota bacterium]